MPENKSPYSELTPQEIQQLKLLAGSGGVWEDLLSILEEFDPEHYAPVERRKPY